ncbi:hypothetical protein Ah1_00059 [Aeromonas phage Ah1]|uniref:Uncharacterized protein n=1 Tax=Aeromonas phage Ah1 TaxID=2053701 RepID=A0A2H4YEK5_9CAUD|nr:hypothetical protein KNT77_gp059 [Aeromonas phage Ah1]AUE22600.1 hypothetical protein Ah1_00059 [Aeromonas phage Ah1]UYD60345.1 hypothetical protein OPFAMLBM_00346 [Aeromonas phage avDM12-TAAL]
MMIRLRADFYFQKVVDVWDLPDIMSSLKPINEFN